MVPPEVVEVTPVDAVICKGALIETATTLVAVKPFASVTVMVIFPVFDAFVDLNESTPPEVMVQVAFTRQDVVQPYVEVPPVTVKVVL